MNSEQAAQQGPRLEVYLSDGRPKPLHWLRTGLERANSVGLIQMKANREGFATGFLVRGGDFIKHMGDEPVFLTNAHVISASATELNDPHVPARTLDEAQVEFTVAGHGVERRVFDFDRILWESPRSELDACLLALKQPPDGMPVCQLSETTPKPGRSRVIVIGHPGGEREMLLCESPVTAFNDKGLLSATATSDRKRLFLRYTNSKIIHGNAGSPVFDIDDWCVVGVHHAGSTDQSDSGPGEAPRPHGNEGIYIRSISEACLRNERPIIPAGPIPQATTGTLQSAPEAFDVPGKGRGKLAHDIPQVMIERRPVVVTVNISRIESDRLGRGLN